MHPKRGTRIASVQKYIQSERDFPGIRRWPYTWPSASGLRITVSLNQGIPELEHRAGTQEIWIYAKDQLILVWEKDHPEASDLIASPTAIGRT